MPSQKPVAVITGAASGIGLAVAEFLVSRQYCVMMADLNYEKCLLESTRLGSDRRAAKCDVSSWESQLETFEKTFELWGRVDVVAANAGILEEAPMLFQTGDKPHKPSTTVFDVDLKSAVYSINLALYFMRKNASEGGRIVVTSSQVGIHPFPYGPIYGAAKAGVRYPYRLTLRSLTIAVYTTGAVDGCGPC